MDTRETDKNAPIPWLPDMANGQPPISDGEFIGTLLLIVCAIAGFVVTIGPLHLL